jgi:hypothetical protein
MRLHLCVAAMIGAALSSAAAAAELPNDAPDGKRWMSCFIRLMDTGRGFNRPIALGGYWLIDVPDGTRKQTEDRLKAQWLDEYVQRIPSEFPGFIAETANGGVSDARCTSYGSRSEWAAFVAHVKEPVTSQSVLRSDYVPTFAEAWVSTREHARGYSGEVGFSGNIKPNKPAATKPGKPPAELSIVAPETGSPGTADAEAKTKEAELARKAAREQREAEFQAKLADHDAAVADYEAKVAARDAEIARQKAKLDADREQAAQVQAEFQRKTAAHELQLAEANRRQQEYFAAQRRHASCLGGDRQACADIAAGKPAIALADAGKASTDNDATRCVSGPVVGPSSAWKDATAATVVNGCPTAVDVRICLLREGGWNCGVNWGLQPQQKWVWSSFKANGEIFWDARVAGSNRPLASPEGS